MSSTREEPCCVAAAAGWTPAAPVKISPVASQRRGGRGVREGMHDFIDVHFRGRSVNPLWN